MTSTSVALTRRFPFTSLTGKSFGLHTKIGIGLLSISIAESDFATKTLKFVFTDEISIAKFPGLRTSNLELTSTIFSESAEIVVFSSGASCKIISSFFFSMTLRPHDFGTSFCVTSLDFLTSSKNWYCLSFRLKRSISNLFSVIAGVPKIGCWSFDTIKNVTFRS